MVRYLKNLNGCSSDLDINSEKLELIELRKEMKRLKRKYEKFVDQEENVQSASEHDDEDEDKVEEIIPKKSSILQKGPRTSVSAEVYGNFNIKQAFVPRFIAKTEEQISRIQNKVLKSFIFNNLDDKELKTVVDAMEEYTCKVKDTIIQQGDPGAVLFIIEKGTYDCFKQFVKYLNKPYQKKDEEAIKVKEYFPGDSFGELALLYNAPRAATIIAKEDGVLWTLDRETFNNIVKEAAIKKREQYESFLKSVDILKSIEPYELSQICDALKSKKYKSGDYIIKQDEIGEEFFIIEEGEAVATKSFNKGEEAQKVYSYNRGGYFGELALIKNEPRAANILASTDCTVLSLERKSFKRLLGPIENILKRNSNDYLKYMGNQQNLICF